MGKPNWPRAFVWAVFWVALFGMIAVSEWANHAN